MRFRVIRLVSLVIAILLLTVIAAALAGDKPLDLARLPPPAKGQVDFVRDIQPLFAGHCYKCHGPKKQKSGLALHRKKNAMEGGDSGQVILPGKSAESLLIQHVASLDKDHVMPPPGEGRRLTAGEIGLLRAWIDRGAVWPAKADNHVGAMHWAYVRPARPPLPRVKDAGWPRNGIDYFVLARLEREGLHPRPEADRASLVRRLSLDLIGLPPTIAEVDAFLADQSPNAYKKLVDRLLASPRYGERWARPWLDLARYADTNGYEKDRPRTIWLWRDWVIKALNDDIPFDRFTIEQIAGDLLPSATTWQKVATGFHRNSMLNDEGGIDPEEFRVVAVKDRVDTTATVWLGTTIECAQCHGHKYDPFTQKEYYQLYAFFNQTADSGVGNGPEIPVAPADELKDFEQIDARVKALQQEVKTKETALNRAKGATAKRIQTELANFKERLAVQELLQEALRPPTTMVMQELAKPRPNYLMLRGDFKQKGPKVEPDVPAVLHSFPQGAPRNRLGLARWLVSKENPLVGRVTVNRFWSAFFGRGLVQTPEDFGTQGEGPTHLELLDWLAVEFMSPGSSTSGGSDRLDWSVKSLHRLIVTSATYRQSSRAPAELIDRDPCNLLYGRGPRLRVEYEMLRDLALSAGGLLGSKIGGPSVMPPQPSGIWENSFGFYDLPNFRWKEAEGADRYRRGIYIFLRRSALYPTFTMFDAPSRDVCSVKRSRTNTPLQALTTLNDPVFVEAAGALARRTIMEAGPAWNDQAVLAFRICLARKPAANEVEPLLQLYKKGLARFRKNPEAAATMIKNSRGNAKGLNAAELAAWTVVANVLLNLDETITKG
jgi:mono/diheme cytochrome c family protein